MKSFVEKFEENVKVVSSLVKVEEEVKPLDPFHLTKKEMKLLYKQNRQKISLLCFLYLVYPNVSALNILQYLFENVYLTDMMILDWIEKEKITDFSNVICISPDEGAMKRARFFSEVLGNVPIGSFYKQRDYSVVIDGKNPIIEHKFLGPNDLSGMIAIVSDDMIASGGSILDTAKQLKSLGASKVYLMVTFALFTNGIENFEQYYKEGYFDKVYATNLSYVPEEIKNKEWFESVDCSYNVAKIINELNYGKSIGEIIEGKNEALTRVRTIRDGRRIR